MNPQFNKVRASSPFLTFVAQEFQQRGSELRAELSDKLAAGKVAEATGAQIAKRHHVLTDISELKPEMLKQRCVLKFARGWSAQGVMLLEQDNDSLYFDYLSLNAYSFEQLVEKQRAVQERFSNKEPAWIIEEFKQGTLPSASIPFDYKFYVFRGQVGLIFQIDRNANPPRVALFDGAFQPLELGVDYLLDESKVQPAPAVIPQRALEFVYWAQQLSLKTDAPFVSIDLFDTADGPVFGEFTFSPGAVQKHMFTLSNDRVEELDSYFQAAEKRLNQSGIPDLRTSSPKGNVVDFNVWVMAAGRNRIEEMGALPKLMFERLANVAYMGGSKGAWRLGQYYQRAAGNERIAAKRQLLESLAAAWARCRALLKSASE